MTTTIENLINLTPHPIWVVTSRDGEALRTTMIRESGTIAHVYFKRRQVFEVRVGDTMVPVTVPICERVEGLPKSVPGTLYIVSRIVAEACRDRVDLIVPDNLVKTGLSRDTYCRSFCVADFVIGGKFDALDKR